MRPFPETDAKKRQNEAVSWVVLADARALSPSEKQQLENWLQTDTRNLGAYVQAQSVYSSLAYSQNASTVDLQHKAAQPTAFQRRRLFAGMCAAGFAGIFLPQKPQDGFSLRHRARQAPEHYTWHGNRVTVDARSSAYFSSDHANDLLQVVDGRIGLQLAHKPVQISAGPLRIKGRKANFDIAFGNQSVILSLYAGSVHFLENSQKHHISAPYRVIFSTQNAVSPQIIESHILSADAMLMQQAWRNGQIILSNTPLENAVDEFNHYSDTQCEIMNAALGQHRISGSFSLLKLDDFVSAVSQLLDCKIRRSGKKIIFYS